MRGASSILAACVAAAALQVGRADAQEQVPGEWVRLSVLDLRAGEGTTGTSVGPLVSAIRALWSDRIGESERRWRQTPGRESSAYPVRTQWAVLERDGQRVMVSSLAGQYECSQTGSFSKRDLFTWCPMRVKATNGAVHTVEGCWIESEAGLVPDPGTHYMRARLVGMTLEVEVVQRGRPVPVCSRSVQLS